MKIKLPILILLLMLSLSGFTQQEEKTSSEKTEESKTKEDESDEAADFGKNELKLNLFAPIYAALELSYERIYGDNSALGLTALYCFSPNNSKGLSIETLWSFTPHYRMYFGKKPASGFFIEANATAAQVKTEYNVYYTNPSGDWTNEQRYYEDLGYGLGFAVGLKFLTDNGLIGEVYLGSGRYFNKNENMPLTYPRVGVMIGKRF